MDPKTQTVVSAQTPVATPQHVLGSPAPHAPGFLRVGRRASRPRWGATAGCRRFLCRLILSPSFSLGLGSGGRQGPWLPRRKATSQATMWLELTLWRQKSKCSSSAFQKAARAKLACHLSISAHTLSPVWHLLPGALGLAGSFPCFRSQTCSKWSLCDSLGEVFLLPSEYIPQAKRDVAFFF